MNVVSKRAVDYVTAPSKSKLLGHEDYWAIWLGAFVLVIGFLINYASVPVDAAKTIAAARATMAAEEARAPIRTVAWHEANDRLGSLRASSHGMARDLGSYLARPMKWTTNPLEAFVKSEPEAAKREAAKVRHEAAVKALATAKSAAQAAEAEAAAAKFADAALTAKARSAIEGWRKARSAESSARAAANAKAQNVIGSLVVLCVGTGLLFSVGAWFLGWSVPKFLIAFPAVFVLAVISYAIAAQADIGAWGLEYVFWAILIGLIISNTIGTPAWLLPAVQVEYYIKTGLVLLGASILFGKIVIIGLPGLAVTWLVTPFVLVGTYWFGQHVLKMESKTLNITVSADMSVSGVSAAIATAAACRAKKEELTLAVGISIIFTSIMMFLMPAFAKAVGMHPVLAGAWMGGTIDSTGSVVAAGALIGPVAMEVAATIKMIQNIMIGFVAFCVAAYWATRVERTPGDIDLSFMGAMREIWARFPKFILGFIGASIAFSVIHGVLGQDLGRVLIDDGVIRGWTSGLQGWFFCLAFVSIGLSTDFRELGHLFKGGKPVTLYVVGQTASLFMSIAMCYVMFFVAFPWVTERLMAR